MQFVIPIKKKSEDWSSQSFFPIILKTESKENRMKSNYYFAVEDMLIRKNFEHAKVVAGKKGLKRQVNGCMWSK